MNKIPVVYQIYPKSFSDSDGDGIGDVQGIIDRLDYLEYLGIDMIWLTPIFKSPLRDNGYDVENYFEIDPRFGNMETVERLIAEAEQRNIGLMFDMVLNHTSTSHEWFKEALRNPQKRDTYFFREKPTNWHSKFGGSAWEYVEDLDLYYLHLFDKTQADLNWNNPDVFRELVEIVNFWLEKGIKGLRFDVINLVSKPDSFEDDFEGDGRRFYTDGPGVHEHLHRLNRETFSKYDDIVTVGELSSTSIEHGVRYATPENEELSTIFSFHHLKVDYRDGDKWKLKPYDFLEFKHVMMTWQEAMQENGAHMSLFLNNHDQPRSISRFGDAIHYPYESSTALAIAMFMMRGMPYIYQGEEIGLPNAKFTSIESYKDVESLNMYKILRNTMSEEDALEILSHRSRDNGRTPIPWDLSPQYGFTTGKPWISMSQHPKLRTIFENISDNNSIFHTYRDIIKVRKENEVIQHGSISFLELEHPRLLIYERKKESEVYLVIVNFYGESVTCPESVSCLGSIILSNYRRKADETIRDIHPFEAIVIHRNFQR